MTLTILRDTADTVRIFSATTGEELDLATAATDELVAWRAAVREYEDNARLAKQTVDAELLARMDRQAKWSGVTDDGGYGYSAPSPAPAVEYDPDELRTRLMALEADGLIDLATINEAVPAVTTYKAQVGRLKQLLKVPGPVADTIRECQNTVEKPRRVTVKKAA